MTEPADEDIFHSVITCLACGHQRREAMLERSCQIVYHCTGCGAVLRPLAGDCCVYCSYGSVPCPAVQGLRRSSATAGNDLAP